MIFCKSAEILANRRKKSANVFQACPSTFSFLLYSILVPTLVPNSNKNDNTVQNFYIVM